MRNPQIFADFDTETDFPVFEKQVGRERNLLSAQFDRFAVGFRAGGEPARFVKFVVIRQVSLRHDSENDAGAEYDGRIVEPVVDSQRHTGDTDRPAGGRVGEQPCESRSACSIRKGWPNRSPQVYPVMQSSGNAATETPCRSASRINPAIRAMLWLQSPAFTPGVAAAIFKNPKSIRFEQFVRYKINEKIRGVFGHTSIFRFPPRLF